jgi:pyruvate/2-oxoglutarate dehydrogenase complex dihydrolipoamide acyltransferase (E2) component
MSSKKVVLPDLGEGLTEAQITRLLVSEGAAVRQLDPLVEVETDKTVSELTSPWEGHVTRILVAEGDWVEVGDEILEIEAI